MLFIFKGPQLKLKVFNIINKYLTQWFLLYPKIICAKSYIQKLKQNVNFLCK